MNTEDLDEKIRQALSEEDAQLFSEYAAEPSLLEMALRTLKGRNRWLSAIVVVVAVVFMVLAVMSAIRFFQTPAENTKELLSWALALVLSLLMVSMMKLWSWMEIEKYSTIREIKRLELQIARLSQAGEQRSSST